MADDVLARPLGLEPAAEGLSRLPTVIGDQMPPPGDHDDETD